MNALLQAIGPVPRLDGAACVGRSDWFEVDPSAAIAEMHRLQERALHVCESCPALRACRASTVPDPDALVWAQGGLPMFDVAARERIRKQYQADKRRRRQEAEAARARAEAEALLSEWKECPR